MFIFCVIPATSHFLRHGLAEKSGRLDEQHDDQHGKDDRVCEVRRDIRLGHGLDDAEQEPAEECAGDGADAAEHRRGKGLDAGHGAGGRHERRIERAEQHTGDGRERGADGEGRGDGRVDVDAHELRRRLILRAGTHGLAHLALVDERGEADHDDDAGRDREKRHIGNGQLAAEDLHSARDHGGIGARGGLPDEQRGVLEEIAHADGGDQDRKARRGAQGLVGKALDDDAEDGAHDNGHQHRDDAGKAQIEHRAEGNVAADHDDVAVGKVQHLGNAVDHRIAEGDDGVHAAEADAADEIG